MSGAPIADFINYWLKEGDSYARRGDYAWMAAQVPGKRILDVGCGVGFGVEALLQNGVEVLAVDNLGECLQTCRARVADFGAQVTFLQGDVALLTDEARSVITEFAPDSVVCWLMGAPTNVTGASEADAGKAVAYYREKTHRQVAELAAALPCVQWLHFVDRTAIPWQAKDIGRDTLVRYHAGKTLLDLPFRADRARARYRKLEGAVADLAQVRRSHPTLQSVTPTLASLLAERTH